MTPKAYMKAVKRTDTDNYFPASTRLANSPRLLHAALGMTTESAEFVDAIKKHVFYGKPLDRTNMVEEVGDLLWYAALALHALGSSFEDAMEANIKKLKARYPNGFTEGAALNRQLEFERAVLEGATDGKHSTES